MQNSIITDNYEVTNTVENQFGVRYFFENGYSLFLTNDGMMSIYDEDEEEVMNAIYNEQYIQEDLNEYGIY